MKLRTCMGRNEIAHKNTNGPDMYITEPMKSIYLDHDSRGIGVEELIINPEHELIIPGWIVLTDGINPSIEFTSLMNPSDGVSFHVTTNRSQILSRDNI